MKLLLLLFSLYILMLGYVYFAQRAFIYFPEHTRPASVPPNYEFKNEGVLLKGWVVNQKGRDAIVYFGGNGESLEYNLPLFKKIFPDRAVYMVSYRGYGDSAGEPSERNIYSDALALYDRVHNQHALVSIIGRSLGSSVATYLASKRPTHRLALVTPFASLEGLASQQFAVFPVKLLLQDKYHSAARVPKISARTLILYAEDDAIIPYSSTQALISAFPASQLESKKIAGAGHNSISGFAEYEKWLREFFYQRD